MWPMHVIFFHLYSAFPLSWCNLVFFFINWLFYNSKSSIPNRLANLFEKIALQSDFCNDSRILCLSKPLHQSLGQYPEKIKWACWWSKPSRKISHRKQQYYYPSRGFYSTSYSFSHQKPLHQIYKSIYGNNTEPGSGISRAIKTAI